MQQDSHISEVLNAKELEAVLESEETCARYFSTLTPEQIEIYEGRLESLKMSEESKGALRAFLCLAKQEAKKNIQDFEKLRTEKERLNLCEKLYTQIKELESIALSL